MSRTQEKQLFALKPGAVTGVIEQPSALIMFKLESRQTLTQDQAKDEIVRTLVKENMAKQEQARKSAVKIEYDEKYLGPLSSDWMPASQLNPGPIEKGRQQLCAEVGVSEINPGFRNK